MPAPYGNTNAAAVSKYKPEYCDTAIELGKEGKSLAGIAAEIGVTRWTLMNWAAAHVEFSTAIELAKEYAQRWWEDAGQEALKSDKPFNSTVYKLVMQGRFRNEYAQRHEVTGRNGKPVEMDHKPDARLDLSGLSEHKLQLLEELLSDDDMDERQAVIEHKLDDENGSSAT